MIRKILNVLVVLLIIAGISFTFINLYNSSKLEGNSFDNSSSKSNKGFEKNKNSKQKIESNDSENNSNSTISDDKNNEDKDKTVSDAENSASDKKSSGNAKDEAQEIEVASTSSFKSNTLTIMGVVFILVGGITFGVKRKSI